MDLSTHDSQQGWPAKDKTETVVALVPAAGVGLRLGKGCPKPYRRVGDVSLICYALKAMEACPAIDRMVVIVSAKEREFCEKEIIPACGLHKPYLVVNGGQRRQQSVYRGLLAIQAEAGVVVIHDAARPFVPQLLVQQSILEAKKCGACVVGIPVRDTLKRVNEEGLVEETLCRSGLWMAQTPQSFQFGLLWKAHQRALEEGFCGTDDAMLVERLGGAVKMIPGSFRNIKITYPEDLDVAERLV